jgi:hypothetical protein
MKVQVPNELSFAHEFIDQLHWEPPEFKAFLDIYLLADRLMISQLAASLATMMFLAFDSRLSEGKKVGEAFKLVITSTRESDDLREKILWEVGYWMSNKARYVVENEDLVDGIKESGITLGEILDSMKKHSS